jgi:hypothetical protein
MRSARFASFVVVLFTVALFSFTPTRAFAQYVVDCTGNTPGAYTSINSVVPLLTNGSVVRITGPCTENVTITGLDNLSIGAPWGQDATLNGNLTLNSVHNLFLYGMSVTNPNGDGIDVNYSTGVTIDNCTASNDTGVGLNIGDSSVTVQDTGTFNNNGNNGIQAEGGATDLGLSGYSGPITVSNNTGAGIELQDGVMESWAGNVIVTNTKASSAGEALLGFGSGYGIQLVGHARAVLYSWSPSMLPPNQISGNQSGGISIQEGSEVSVSGVSQSGSGPWITSIIDGNGPVGIYVGLGSQLSVFGGVQITNHPDAAIDVFGHSQVSIDGNNQITNNGSGPSATYPTHAGVRIDDNSEAYIRDGQITQNGGPGVLVLGNSSINVSGTTLTSNLGGPYVCDSSSWLITDEAEFPTGFGFAAPCKIPNSTRPKHRSIAIPPRIPNMGQMKAQQARYRQLIASF